MKPIKNRNFCIDCSRTKMLFASEKKAVRCIKMNGDEIFEASGRRPIRAYYCIACGGWHITSKELELNFHSKVELYFMKQDEKKRALKHLKELIGNYDFEKEVKTKVSALSEVVMRKRILKSQCEEMIQQLISIFDNIVKAHLITELIEKYFNRFCSLCSAFQEKVNKGKIRPEPKIITI